MTPHLYQPKPPHCPTWIQLQGPDAKDFLQRLTTINVRTLNPGDGAEGCFLNAQGKILAYFTLWCLGEASYGFEVEGEWKQKLLSTLEQFTFAEKMTLSEKDPTWECFWIFDAPMDLPPLHSHTEESIRICRQADEKFSKPWLTLWGPPSALTSWIHAHCPQTNAVDFKALEQWRIQALTPRVDAEITETAIPLEVNLHKAVAHNKGCYPGQEVIERIRTQGAPPRRLVQLQGTGPGPSAGDKIFPADHPETALGEITSVSAFDPQWIALGLIRKSHTQEGLHVQLSSGLQATLTRVAAHD